jgi:hypothetical protein
MIDFTRLGGVVRPTFVGAVIDAYSRKVLATGFIPGEPNARFAASLLQHAVASHGSPTPSGDHSLGFGQPQPEQEPHSGAVEF